MIRLHFIVEGQTEQEFVKDLVAEELNRSGYDFICDARLIRTSRDFSAGMVFKGGSATYNKVKNDIIRSIKDDGSSDSYFTTMFDYYKLPKDFPGMPEVKHFNDPYKAVEMLEQNLKEDIAAEIPNFDVKHKFLPNIMCHEFETIILTDVTKLLDYYENRRDSIQRLSCEVNSIGNPEFVNSDPSTAPSRRIIKAIQEYDKVFCGVCVATDIGIGRIRSACVHFDSWLTALEKLKEVESA